MERIFTGCPKKQLSGKNSPLSFKSLNPDSAAYGPLRLGFQSKLCSLFNPRVLVFKNCLSLYPTSKEAYSKFPLAYFFILLHRRKNKFPLERRIRGSPSIQRMTLEPECDIKLSDTKYDIQICMPLKFDTLKSERQKPGALESCVKLIRLFFILTVGYFLFFLLIF